MIPREEIVEKAREIVVEKLSCYKHGPKDAYDSKIWPFAYHKFLDFLIEDPYSEAFVSSNGLHIFRTRVGDYPVEMLVQSPKVLKRFLKMRLKGA